MKSIISKTKDDSIRFEFNCNEIDYFFNNEGEELIIDLPKGSKLHERLTKIQMYLISHT